MLTSATPPRSAAGAYSLGLMAVVLLADWVSSRIRRKLRLQT